LYQQQDQPSYKYTKPSSDGGTRALLQSIPVHERWIYSLEVDEERIYSGSFDKTIAIVDPMLCSLPPFFQQCMAFGTVFADIATEQPAPKQKHNNDNSEPRDATHNDDRHGNENEFEQQASAKATMIPGHDIPLLVTSVIGNVDGDEDDDDDGSSNNSNHSSITDTRDCMLRTTMMACAQTGSVQNAIRLLELGCKHGSLSHTTPYGQSALFYALRGNHWNFIVQLQTWIQQHAKHNQPMNDGAIQVDEADISTRQLLVNRAAAGDVKFFEQLLKWSPSIIHFHQREVVSAAIKYNHLWLLERWKDINNSFALYEFIVLVCSKAVVTCIIIGTKLCIMETWRV
jgi:hypothetical protein